MSNATKETVIVLDFGGQYNQLIARRVRECNVYCEILPYTVDIQKIKDINPPADIRDAMEKEMNAERNKRAMILESEAQRQSAITIAEGKKQAAILEAEADKESRIRRAVGEAQAIKEVAEAKAKEIQMVYDAMKKADPNDKLVQLKSLEALEEVAKGDANKVFIPFEATSALSSLGAMKEIVTDKKDT
jgi:regulator of protease activity HflC (stomatin/prohibitin superfamily)